MVPTEEANKMLLLSSILEKEESQYKQTYYRNLMCAMIEKWTDDRVITYHLFT